MLHPSLSIVNQHLDVFLFKFTSVFILEKNLKVWAGNMRQTHYHIVSNFAGSK